MCKVFVNNFELCTRSFFENSYSFVQCC
jgi:hypothetical protein